MPALVATCRVLTVLFVPMQLGGCSIAIERSFVSSAFAAQFDCPAPTVSYSPGGYRVEGCDTTAFYHCTEPRHSSDSDTRGNDGVAAVGAIIGLLDLALSSGDCFLEHHRTAEAQRRERLEPSIDTGSLNVIPKPVDARVLGRVLVLGGQLELLAIPGKYPDHVLLTVHGNSRLSYDDCRPWIVRDGQALRFTAQHAKKPYEMSLVVPVAQLLDLGSAVRFGGNVCGLRFELGERERKTLAGFELRRQNVLMQAAAAHD